MANLFGSVKEALHGTYKSTVTALTGPLKESRFLQEGVLTPEEVPSPPHPPLTPHPHDSLWQPVISWCLNVPRGPGLQGTPLAQ